MPSLYSPYILTKTWLTLKTQLLTPAPWWPFLYGAFSSWKGRWCAISSPSLKPPAPWKRMPAARTTQLSLPPAVTWTPLGLRLPFLPDTTFWTIVSLSRITVVILAVILTNNPSNNPASRFSGLSSNDLVFHPSRSHRSSYPIVTTYCNPLPTSVPTSGVTPHLLVPALASRLRGIPLGILLSFPGSLPA